MISKWEAGDGELMPRPVNQAALDTAFRRADEATRQRFAALLVQHPLEATRSGRRGRRRGATELERIQLIRMNAKKCSEAMRAAMVDQIISWQPLSAAVAKAMRKVDRHVFVPDVSLEEAYADDAVVTLPAPGTD